MPQTVIITRDEAISLLAWQKLFSLDPEKRTDIVAELFVESDQEDEDIEDIHAADATHNPNIIAYLKKGLLNVSNEYIAEDLKALYQQDLQIEGEPEVFEKCPCCSYRTIEEKGAYDVCPNCYWEDDGTEDPQSFSSVNHMTLQEGRDNYEKLGASDPAFVELVNKHPNKYLQ